MTGYADHQRATGTGRTLALVTLTDDQQAVADHLQWCRERDLRPSTISSRVGELRRLAEFTGSPVTHLDADQLSAWWADLTDRVTANTRAVCLAHIREFYRWAVRVGVRPDDPSVHLSRPRRRRRLPRPAPDHVLAEVFDKAPDRIRWAVTLAAYAGLRAGEIAALHRRDFEDRDGLIVIFVADGKGGHQRIIPAHPIILELLDELPGQGWLFPRRDRRPGHVSAKLVSTICSQWFRARDLDVTLHRFRHWFGTSIYAASLDLRVTQELMGHSSPVTTAGYAAHNPTNAIAAVAALPTSG